MELIDLRKKQIWYDWKTIYVGIIQKFFEFKVISDYAVELMEKGEDDDFITELAWGVDSNDIQQVLFELKNHYFPDLEEDSSDYEIEEQKLRFVSLSELNETVTDTDDLLKKIAEFYGNNGYPEDMVEFINYMPQEVPTSKEDLINRFHCFLNSEENKVKEK
ncbi:hypothetical protein CKN82_08195 [Carnobacterium divergens]|uniref:DUF2247 family protein n=1 Tax=Carnobacterium divergens TaxID=2748 RepID=UPI000E74157D|nr:DUF2247 family protein [Carnobacterium divergens]ANZ99624.1 hypothetical protein BFC22_05755 [Carnobacterium divergens]MDT1996878.1 DUF2247 family protein [Carnobacterium divergens]TFI68289.1 hypothetical protein CKN70_08245 [Carnobacterium divergens]TFI80600.1 hypothetical protein CKN68_08205 [Carnobacterium divergens]TFI88431.1 hypothetical protein CKN72_08075 [Carnobacterium divergens]